MIWLLAGCEADPPVEPPTEPLVAPWVVDPRPLPHRQATGPNVLLVIADDVGTDKVGLYGEPAVAPPTPTIDALGARGVWFRNAWSSPSCSPTRATVMTGRYGRRTGIGTIIDSWLDEAELAESELTVAEVLDAEGWSTSLAGKWHLGSLASDLLTHPWRQGFQWHAGSISNLVDALEGSPRGEGYYRWNKLDNGALTVSTTYATTDTTDDALARMAAMAEPWFLVASFNAGHVPSHLPPAELHTRPDLTDASSDPDKIDAAIEALDTELGRLLDAVDEQDTVVFLVGDNGTSPFAVREPGDPDRSKGTVYQGGVRVPLIVAGAGVEATGECTALVHTTDLFSTIVALAGVDVASLGPQIDGVSLLPYLADPAAPSIREYAFTEEFRPNGPGPYEHHNQAVRDARFKLVRLHTGVEAPGDGDALYDLEGRTIEGPDLLRDGPDALSPEAADAWERLLAELDRIDADLEAP